MMLSIKNYKVPSPKWFRVTKKIVSWASNITIAILIVYIPEESKEILVAKLIQSSAMELIDIFIGEFQNEGGADADS